MTDSGLIAAYAVQTTDDQGNSIPSADQKGVAAFLFPAQLAVDANRDGLIKFAGNDHDPDLVERPSDFTTPDKPFRFWLNDDQDDRESGETVPALTPDYAQDQIRKVRNLEDFTRLDLHPGGLPEAICNQVACFFRVGVVVG